MSRKPESIVRQKVRKILERAGWLCTPYPASIAGYRGVADFICCTPKGRYAEIEVKTDTGKASPMQQYRALEVRKKGIFLFVCPSTLDNLEKQSKLL